MITRLLTSNFRMLRANSIALPPFAVLVGKNATGKSTFLGALQFISDLVGGGVPKALERALGSDAPSFADLCFDPLKPIALALELSDDGIASSARYEVEVGPAEPGGVSILKEALYLLPADHASGQQSLWDDEALHAMHGKAPKGWRKVLSKTPEGRDYFADERTNWNNVFRFGPERSALGAMPEDPERFPRALGVRDQLRAGVRFVELESDKLRAPSAPRSGSTLVRDGSNLPHVARALKEADPQLFEDWVQHVATAVDGLRGIELWDRPEDRKLVLQARFEGQHDALVPSWLLSDGTLRLLALSLLSFTASLERSLVMVEEPENGLHPLAMQAVYAALSQPPPGSQVLVATHSPVFLASVPLDHALVFRRMPNGAGQVLRGREVAELQHWRGSANLADVFATGVLA